eukprot:TsM_000333600 transcript=TsM_000333600 gene=TsM_000333600
MPRWSPQRRVTRIAPRAETFGPEFTAPPPSSSLASSNLTLPNLEEETVNLLPLTQPHFQAELEFLSSHHHHQYTLLLLKKKLCTYDSRSTTLLLSRSLWPNQESCLDHVVFRSLLFLTCSQSALVLTFHSYWQNPANCTTTMILTTISDSYCKDREG